MLAWGDPRFAEIAVAPFLGTTWEFLEIAPIQSLKRFQACKWWTVDLKHSHNSHISSSRRGGPPSIQETITNQTSILGPPKHKP